MPKETQSDTIPATARVARSSPPPGSLHASSWKKVAFGALERLGLNRAFRLLNRGKIKVLVLHSVRDDGALDNALSRAEFERLLDYLQRHHSVIGMSDDGEWIGVRKDRVNVLLTFDDGFVDNVDIVAPILMKRGINGLFFLIGECVEHQRTPLFLRDRPSVAGADLSTVDAAAALRLASMGMTVGSHSMTHRDFRELLPGEVLDEAKGSKEYLTSAAGRKVESFAFPWGHYLPWQVRAVRAHYHRVFTVAHGFNHPEDTVICRNDVATAEHGYAAASGALDALRALLIGSRGTSARS